MDSIGNLEEALTEALKDFDERTVKCSVGDETDPTKEADDFEAELSKAVMDMTIASTTKRTRKKKKTLSNLTPGNKPNGKGLSTSTPVGDDKMDTLCVHQM